MRILIVVQGEWGQRIANHIIQTHPVGWKTMCWQGPAHLPSIIDEPQDFVPDSLPQADLLLVLTQSAGMTDLAPDLAQRCGAKAVIIPVDRRSWARPGLIRQVKKRMDDMGLGSALPMPFCSLRPSKSQHPLIRQFSQRYGQPELTCTLECGQIAACQIVRETPCGNTRYIAQRLIGTPTEKAVEQAGLSHHYYPCWGGMETDPVHGKHTPLHIAATIAQKSVARALKRAGHQNDEQT